jgi:succinoglycan biosynthesis transport protein ExoP
MQVTSSGLQAKTGSAVQHYLAVIKHRKWPMLLVFLVPLILAIVVTIRQDASYQASAQVLLRRQNLANALTGTPDPSLYTSDFLRIAQTQAQVARSPIVAARVIKDVGARGLTPDGFLASSSVTVDPNADLLAFSATDADPQLAIKLTTAYANEYVVYAREIDTAALRAAEQQLNERARSIDPKSSAAGALAQTLASKKQEIDTLQALQTANATVIRRADSAAQVTPRTKRNVALGIIAGIVLAIAIAALLEGLDTRVRSGRDVEDLLGIPLLARASAPKSALHGKLLMLEAPTEAEAESFRVLRLAVRQAMDAGTLRSLMVTSSVKGEGKSTTVANLAVAMARAGDRVVLVDLDLRRPTLRRLFDRPPSNGVSDVLAGRVDLQDALQVVPISGMTLASSNHAAPGETSEVTGGWLRILQAGTALSNPGEVTASPALGQMLRELTEHCDIVLIDTPPSLQVGDALAAATMVDGLFVCVRVPDVTRPMLNELSHALSKTEARILGFVLTGRVREDDDSYGVRYGYSGVADEPAATAGPVAGGRDAEAVESSAAR